MKEWELENRAVKRMRQFSFYTSENRASWESHSAQRKDETKGRMIEGDAGVGLSSSVAEERTGSLRMRVQFYVKNYKFNSIIGPNQLHNQTIQNLKYECSKYGQSKLQKTTLLRNFERKKKKNKAS